MRLHLSSAQPWCWAANWSNVPNTPTMGGCELIDADGHQDWPHRALYALAEALACHNEDCGHLPPGVELLLTPVQATALGDFQRRLQHGPWGSVHATALAAVIVRKGIEIRILSSSRNERKWMERLGGQVAVSSTVLGMGGVASRVVGERNLGRIVK